MGILIANRAKMIDWGKYWLRNPTLIGRVLANPELDFEQVHSTRTGEVREYPMKAIWKCWEIEVKSSTWMELRGSFHKHWNGGTNENDFAAIDLYRAVAEVCGFLQVSPYDLSVHNLEFGLNIRPAINASEIIREIICYKNRIPANPIDDNRGYFIEFKMTDCFIKIYDKGKQSQEVWKLHAGNILRIEVKARNSGFLQFAGITTVADLLNPVKLAHLGRKLDYVVKKVVFDDDSIAPAALSLSDKKVYQQLSNPRQWVFNRKNKTSTIDAQERRFNSIVSNSGSKQHSHTISKLVHNMWQELVFLSEPALSEVKEYLKKYNS
jgi:hypothetical protein